MLNYTKVVNLSGRERVFDCCLTYYCSMELFTTVVLALVAMVVGIGLVIYGVKGRRESQARDGRTYKRGRL
jgi:hypothetical protein